MGSRFTSRRIGQMEAAETICIWRPARAADKAKIDTARRRFNRAKEPPRSVVKARQAKVSGTVALLLPRVRLSPVIGAMPEGLHPGVIFYPHTRCGNLCLSKTVTLNFLDSHPREGIKPHYGLYQNPPIGVEVVPLLLKPTRSFPFKRTRLGLSNKVCTLVAG
jgi:hypothetical protein